MTFPKAMLVGVTLAPGWMPVPVRDVETDAALLVTVTEPVTLPAAVGAKLTEPFAVAPGARVRGRVNPEALNPVPLAETAETTRLALPLF